MTEKMLSRRDGAIGHMIFNQPEKHNAVSLEMWEAAERIMRDFEADPEIRVLVLSGAGASRLSPGRISRSSRKAGAQRMRRPTTMPAPGRSIGWSRAFPSRPSR